MPSVLENLPPAARRALVWSVKLGLVAAIVWGVRRTLLAAFADLAAQRSQLGWQVDFGWMALAAVLYLLGLFPCGVFYHRLLHRLRQPAPLRMALAAYYVGHLGKYVPGKALVVILRAGMVRSAHVQAGIAALAVFYETLTCMAVGALVAGILLLVDGRTPQLTALAIGLVLLAGLPTLPPVMARLAKAAGVARGRADQATLLRRVNVRTLLGGWLSMGLGWGLVGLSLWATLRGMGFTGQGAWQSLGVCTAAAALATVAGFVSLIPGGAVVRELVLMQLLAPWLEPQGEAKALVGAVAVRLVWLLSEVAISVILYGAHRHWRQAIGAAPPAESAASDNA